MKAIIGAWKTLTDTLSVVGQSSSPCLYPLLSFIIMLLVTFTVMIPLLGRVLVTAHEDVSTRIFFFLVVYFIIRLSVSHCRRPVELNFWDLLC